MEGHVNGMLPDAVREECLASLAEVLRAERDIEAGAAGGEDRFIRAIVRQSRAAAAVWVPEPKVLVDAA